MKYKVTTERTDGEETIRFTKVVEMKMGQPRVGDTSQTLTIPPITTIVVSVTPIKEKENGAQTK